MSSAALNRYFPQYNLVCSSEQSPTSTNNILKDPLSLSAQLPNTEVFWNIVLTLKKVVCWSQQSPHSSKPCLFFLTELTLKRVLCYSLISVPIELIFLSQQSEPTWERLLSSSECFHQTTKADYALMKVLLQSNLVISTEHGPHSIESRLTLKSDPPFDQSSLQHYALLLTPYAAVNVALTL